VAVLEPPAPSAVAVVAQTIEACRQAREMVGQELTEAERSLELRARRVRDAGGAVIATEVLEDMIADAERLRAELWALEAVLSFLHSWIPRDQAAKVEKALASSDAASIHRSRHGGRRSRRWRATQPRGCRSEPVRFVSAMSGAKAAGRGEEQVRSLGGSLRLASR
jgi:hypothetical protein